MPTEDIPSAVWRCAEVRDALAVRDIGTVYRALRAHGVSQSRIAQLTGQAQSEVSDVLNGRAVRSYELLSRIATGLGIPRGWMGLAGEQRPATTERGASDVAPDEEDEQTKRRKFLSYAGSLVLGSHSEPAESALRLPAELRYPDLLRTPPGRVGASDVAALDELIGSLRRIDQRYGGVGQYGTVAAATRHAELMLESSMCEDVRSELLATLCKLHATAGWTAVENGLLASGHEHFGRALDFGRDGADPLAIARTLYAAGRAELHFGDANSALKLFQLGSIRAESSTLVSSVLQLNSAWAAAQGERGDSVRRLLDHGRGLHAAAKIDADYPLFRWFGEADLLGMTGSIQLAMGEFESAALHLSRAVAARAPGEVRSAVFELASLAEAKFALGDHGAAIRHGRRSVLLAGGVRSARLHGRLAGLRARCAEIANSRHPWHDCAEELAQGIDSVIAPRAVRR
ncbi:helix-turn-helix transcriptional regulator [Saccharopolyspora gloriosae]|uniref:Transcriptional regulator with XRE-family HTH domain n=1 Tax=Saccharopolyspora gloriosae TaxID=455344 RepID=A0A840NLT6_9PSEU|nr:helix-turn-helix transcriptional regulator [Saccharopolyspora gloriosae]MBB5070985.1 transcriptional regulator with XRE-family HTH domain [Saccharopolyspora gloriosae]